MAQRIVRYSDVSGKIIDDDDDVVVRIVVDRHPALVDGPVEIEVAQDEANALISLPSTVDLILHRNDGSDPEQMTVELRVFNDLAGHLDMTEILRQATPVSQPRRPRKPAGEKLDYATLEHAGKPHRGKTTDAEKEIVRENLAAVNDRLRSEGVRTIDLDNAEHVIQYGLENLAKRSGRRR